VSDDSKLSEIRLRHGVMPASAGEVAFQADADRDYLLKLVDELQTLLKNERSSPAWGAIGEIAAAVGKSSDATVADVVAEVKRLASTELDEGVSYAWARQALAPIEKADSGCEVHRYQSTLDKVASAVREAWAHRGRTTLDEPAAHVSLAGGDRVVTAAKLQEKPNCALACGQEQRKPSAHGMIDFEINPEDGGGFQVVHDDGTQAPYSADELTPEDSDAPDPKDILGTPEFWASCAEATFARVTPSRLAEVKGKTDEQVHAELVASGHVPDPACVLREMVHDYERVGDYGDGLVLRNCLQAHADNGTLPDDELTGLMLADYEARYRAAEVALWHKHKDAEARPQALDPDAPGLDDMTRRRRIVLRRITEKTDAEILASLVDAGIYTPQGELTPPYRNDAEPSACRPTGTLLDEYDALIAAARKGAT
jgi:hypothetical protein